MHAGSSCVALRPDGDPVGTAGGAAQSCKLRAHALQLLDCRCILERILSLAACQPYCVINARWRRGSWFATHSFLNQQSWTRASAWHVRTHATQCQHPKCRCKTIVQRRLADTGAIGFVNSSWPQFDVSHSWQCCIKPGMCWEKHQLQASTAGPKSCLVGVRVQAITKAAQTCTSCHSPGCTQQGRACWCMRLACAATFIQSCASCGSQMQRSSLAL